MTNTSWKGFLGIKWFSSSPDLHIYEVTTTFRTSMPTYVFIAIYFLYFLQFQYLL